MAQQSLKNEKLNARMDNSKQADEEFPRDRSEML